MERLTNPDRRISGEDLLGLRVDGVDLIEMAASAEQPFAIAEGDGSLAGEYQPPSVSEFGWWLWKRSPRNATAVLGVCECGEPGCWALETDWIEDGDLLRWRMLRQPQRRWWTYEAIGSLAFERSQVEAAFEAVGLALPEPRVVPPISEPLPAVTDIAAIELVPHGYRDRLDIGDLVRALVGAARYGQQPGISPSALEFAAAIGATTGAPIRQRLKDYVAPLLRSGDGERAESRRRGLLLDWYTETFVPTFLGLAARIPPVSDAAWLNLRNTLRDGATEATRTVRRATSVPVRRFAPFADEDAPPGPELLHLFTENLASGIGLDGETDRIIWSACWYATALAIGAHGEASTQLAMKRLLESAFDLLGALIR